MGGGKVTFQERLKWARKRKGWTMEQLAAKIGVAKSTYANYELSNREPNIATIQALAKALDVSADFLLGISDQPNAPNTNAKLYLNSRNLHWDGIELEEDELRMIRDFLEYTISKRISKNPGHPGDAVK